MPGTAPRLRDDADGVEVEAEPPTFGLLVDWPGPPQGSAMRVAIGSDHAGFQLKEHFKGMLKDGGHEVIDLGTDSEEPVDYPPICAGVGKEVAAGRAERGIVLGGAAKASRSRRTRCAVCAPRSATTCTRRSSRGGTTTPTCCRSALASSARASPTRSCGSGWSPSSKVAVTSAASTRSPHSSPSDPRGDVSSWAGISSSVGLRRASRSC